MSPVPHRRSWWPGAVLLAAASVVAVASGLTLEASGLGIKVAWPWYVGIAAATLLVIGWAERLWTHKQAPIPRERVRGKLKVIQGGKAAPYDLAKDHSTDSQRYLM